MCEVLKGQFDYSLFLRFCVILYLPLSFPYLFNRVKIRPKCHVFFLAFLETLSHVAQPDLRFLHNDAVTYEARARLMCFSASVLYNTHSWPVGSDRWPVDSVKHAA